jgi:hypothetical protein
MRYAHASNKKSAPMLHALPPGWEEIANYHDALRAELEAGFLRAEHIEVRVETLGLVPGCESGARLLVLARDAYRARALMALEPATEDELARLALAASP